MEDIEINGVLYHFSDNGLLEDASCWNPDIACYLAARDHLTLDKKHWDIINYLRSYGAGRGVWRLADHMGTTLGKNISNMQYIDKLFPSKGYAYGFTAFFYGLHGACTYASIFLDRFFLDKKEFKVDVWGELEDKSLWVPDVAVFMAKQDCLELTSDHWQVINDLRSYLRTYHIPPPPRVLKNAMEKIGIHNVNQLFYGGLYYDAYRYAGMTRSAGEFQLRFSYTYEYSDWCK
jgi:tRNA 2-thiouridine synthesizing protein E